MQDRWLNMFRRGANILLAVGIAFGCVLVLQKSFHFIGKGPLLSVDDSIPNVGVTLAEHERYGFLSSPTQGPKDVDRTHAFFNYGPLYFYAAAALTWLTGPSLAMFRMLHPLGLVAIVLASIFALRRFSIIGPALFAVAMFHIYLLSHWPMARPDIVVSICVVLMFLFAAHAIERGDSISWFAVGFFACSATTTHQIAVSVILAAPIIWLWSVAADWRERKSDFARQAGASFLSVALGGVAGALLYLAAIDFRVRDLWELAHAYNAQYTRPYQQVLNSHLYYAWSSLDKGSFLLVKIGFGCAALLSVAGYFLPEPWRRRILAYIMPPVLVSVFYQLSLGFYGNNHSGYVILSQVATLWAIAALTSLAIFWFRETFRYWGPRAEMAAIVVALLVMVKADIAWARWPSTWQIQAVGNVDMNDYIREVESPLPEGAAAWGSLFFGLDAGDRTDLVQCFQMLQVVHDDFRADRRSKVAPDYLVLGSYESDIDFGRCVGGEDCYLENVIKLFPGIRYRLERLIYAPPYGTTREYRRVSQSDQEDAAAEMGVAVNDGASRQWSRRLSVPLDVAFTPADNVTVHIEEYSLKVERRALASLVASLPSGFFLLEVAIDRSDPERLEFVTATPGRYFHWHAGWVNFPVPATWYLAGEKSAFLLVDHLGGPLYISRFECAAASSQVPAFSYDPTRTAPSVRRPGASRIAGEAPHEMRVVSVRRVLVLPDESGRIQALNVPVWTRWTHQEPNITIGYEAGSVLRLSGSAKPWAWLLQSPPITMPPHQRFVLTMPNEPTSGTLAVGVLGSDGNWLASPTPMPRRVAFDTRTSKQVSIVISNGELGPERPFNVAFRPPELVPVAPQEQYADRLMGCRSPYIAKSADCAK